MLQNRFFLLQDEFCLLQNRFFLLQGDFRRFGKGFTCYSAEFSSYGMSFLLCSELSAFVSDEIDLLIPLMWRVLG